MLNLFGKVRLGTRVPFNNRYSTSRPPPQPNAQVGQLRSALTPHRMRESIFMTSLCRFLSALAMPQYGRFFPFNPLFR